MKIGSTEHQIASVSLKISKIQAHLKANPKDKRTLHKIFKSIHKLKRLKKYKAKRDLRSQKIE